MWWAKDPDRLKREVEAVGALREQESWLWAAVPRLLKGLKFAFDFDVIVNDETFPFTLEYPSFFPVSPPLVIPRDGRRLSNHQYGDGGELCLEYRSDNWDPSVTGAMMMVSTYRLLAGERPTHDERAIVPSAHHDSLGQRLRGRHCRFLLTPTLLAYVAGLPIGSSCVGSAIEIVVPKRVWVAYVASLGAGVLPDWREGTIPDRGHKGDPIVLLRIADLKEVPSEPDRGALDGFIASARGEDGLPSANGLMASGFIVIADATSARMFYLFSRDGEQIVIPYQTIDLAGDSGCRLPERYDVLVKKKVGIAGCGSLGSKIAASLARSGVGEFVLVDDDIMRPGNLIRHELDADSLGAHKAEALETRLKAVAVGVKVSARRVALGGQESSGSTESVLDELARCDLVIDATADPQAFNFVASVARGARRPMVWAEVYAGGIGGFVARLRPDHEPPPHAARRQYLAWCREQGVPWHGHDRDYGAHGAESQPLVADDGDVSVIAAHATRMAVDALVHPDASQFPHSAYAIGMAREWIFEGPFDTRPIDFAVEGSWATPASPERTVEALDFMASLFEQGENADRTGT
jgi:molybdopterin/thiamine biosynthesis adenylyltransferase